MPDDLPINDALKIAPTLAVLIVSLENPGVFTDESAIARALSSKALQDAVKEQLMGLAQEHMKASKPGDKPADPSGTQALKKLADGTIAALGRASTAELGKTREAADLSAAAHRLENWFRGTPAGVWFDKNKNVIYIVAAGLSIGGAVACYVTRAGDQVTAPVMKFAGKQLAHIELGKFVVGVNEFVPGTRTVDLRVAYSDTWQRIKTDFSIDVKAIDKQIAAVDASGAVLMSFSGGVDLGVKADVKRTATTDCALGLTLNLKEQKLKFDLMASTAKGKFDKASLGASQAIRAGGADMALGLNTSLSGQGEFRVMSTFSINM